MLYQRTGPEGTLGLWLLLSSRVALLSVNIRYIVSWYTPAGVSPKGTVWGSGQGQWEGIYSLASKAISHHSLWLCLLQHLWESPLHCISLSGILQACPLWRLKTLNLTSVFTGMMMWDVAYAPASQGYGWICWWSLLIRATTFVFWAPAKASLSGRWEPSSFVAQQCSNWETPLFPILEWLRVSRWHCYFTESESESLSVQGPKSQAERVTMFLTSQEDQQGNDWALDEQEGHQATGCQSLWLETSPE